MGSVGTTAHDGQPLKSGTATFDPVGSGPLAVSSIDENRRYELRIGNDCRITPGDCLVTVGASARHYADGEMTDPR